MTSWVFQPTAQVRCSSKERKIQEYMQLKSMHGFYSTVVHVLYSVLKFVPKVEDRCDELYMQFLYVEEFKNLLNCIGLM